MLDVRDPAEFRAGHRPGSVSAPGGQLVQATDQWIGVRNARIVLVDDTGARARMAGAWLRQMGHRDVFVVEGGLEAIRTAGTERTSPPELTASVPTIDVTGLVGLLDSGDDTVVIDLARSIDYREGHIPGAVWGVRTRLATLASQLAGAKHVVITSPDGVAARLAVEEVKGLSPGEVRALDGGTDAWHAFGRPLVKDRTTPPDEACIDSYLRAYDRNSGVEEAMQAYLTWEIELANQIKRDNTVAFGVGEASANHDAPPHGPLRLLSSGAWQVGRTLLDLLLPPQCVACDQPVQAPGHSVPRAFARPASSPSRSAVVVACRSRAPHWAAWTRCALRAATRRRCFSVPARHSAMTRRGDG